MEGGGTEAFPHLGSHCQEEDCRQLDFLPFRCDGCRKVFCLEHRSYRDHSCPRADHKSRLVVVCKTCSISMEKKPGKDEEEILKQHADSGGCDPRKKQKPRCPARRCRELLTFSNTSTCKSCNQKVCLKHRFPSEHACSQSAAKVAHHHHLPAALTTRSGTECREKKATSAAAAATLPQVKAF